MAESGPNQNQQEPYIADLQPLDADTFELLWIMVWREMMSARGTLASARYDLAIEPRSEVARIAVLTAEDIFRHCSARLTFLENWERENLTDERP